MKKKISTLSILIITALLLTGCFLKKPDKIIAPGDNDKNNIEINAKK